MANVMTETDVVLIYSTFPSAQSARDVAGTLIAEKRIACANILSSGQSLYAWKGAIETVEETVVVFKTCRSLAEGAIERGKALHPYEIPCFLILPVDGGWPPYLAWIADATA